MESKGILYVATGEQHIYEATKSAQYTRKHMDVPIAIVTDQQPDTDIFDRVITVSKPEYSSVDKPKNLLQSPFEQTLYLDCDAIVLEPVSELFELLNQYELLVATDPNEAGKIHNPDEDAAELPSSLPIFQTGVIAYRQTKSFEELINTWTQNAIKNNYSYEQTAFREAMYENNLNWMTLTHLYNCLNKWPMQVTGQVKIMHGHLNNWSEDRIDKIKNRMNSNHNPRLFYYPGRTRLRSPTHPYLNFIIKRISLVVFLVYTLVRIFKRVAVSFKRNGFLVTLREILNRMMS
jgi:hypothetical protein